MKFYEILMKFSENCARRYIRYRLLTTVCV